MIKLAVANFQAIQSLRSIQFPTTLRSGRAGFLPRDAGEDVEGIERLNGLNNLNE